MYIISAITANTEAAIHASSKYIRAFTSGGLPQFWPHLILLGGAIAGEVAVAVGIILESPKEKTLREWVGMGFVLCGVVISAVFTIGLFVFDEGVSNAQQSNIAALVVQENADQITIANTNSRAADANEHAAEIIRATAWRGFTAHEANILESDLSAHPGKILLGWVLGDPESLSLAIQFNNILQAANKKWNVAPDAQSFPNSLVWGIRIPDAPNAARDTAQRLRKAFADAGIKIMKEDLPKSTGIGWGVSDAKVKETRVLIFFGSKQPTFMQPPP